MIKTVVVWPQNGIERNPNFAQSAALSMFAEKLCGYTRLGLYNVESDTEIIATRSWPTIEAAQAWIDYILANYNVTSAIIETDQ